MSDGGDRSVFGPKDAPGPKWTVDDRIAAACQGWFIRKRGAPRISFDEAWDQTAAGGVINFKYPDKWSIESTGVEQRNPDGTRGGIITDAEAVAMVDRRAQNGDKLARKALAFIAFRRISDEVD